MEFEDFASSLILNIDGIFFILEFYFSFKVTFIDVEKLNFKAQTHF